MSACCADMMAAKVGPDAKPFVVQPMIEAQLLVGKGASGFGLLGSLPKTEARTHPPHPRSGGVSACTRAQLDVR